jgi:hypothetical protein
MYIKLPDIYPYTLARLKSENPQVSFPQTFSPELLAEYGVYSVQETAMPEGDVVTEASPILIDGVWTQQWNVRSYTSEEIAANLQNFRDSSVVTPRQARLALLQNGITDANIQAVIATIQEPEKSAVTIEWEYALEIRRNNTWVSSLGSALGLTEEQLDSLFELAETL